MNNNKSKRIKELSLREFTESATKYDDAGKYDNVKQDYKEVIGIVNREEYHRLLDCGCGTGNLLALLSEGKTDASYVGVDITPVMIEEAQKKKLRNVSFHIADSEELNIEERDFDVITCVHSFHHYPNPQMFLSSSMKLLKKNGRLIIADNGRNSKFEYWLTNHIIYPLWNNLILKAGDYHCYNEKEMISLANEAGFLVEHVKVENKKLMCIFRKA